ncbi:MarR family transcriptional regulator [Paraburkholderia sp. SUR17]|uniref:MarR family winged helix-turn-helix transcriptional regulator n=1 Tax=Paraburkholderia sp. SUR17 TaxID=3034358 RepID=UPI002407BB52|nr:MarR family transcriptional regulator [Paraburkholderia sp. SUR17]WEY41348.1 MarR family transcriptional regulator [Paraburkholderia sp. SUR17]
MGKSSPKTSPASARGAALLAESVRDVVGRLVRAVREQSGTQSNAQNETLGFLERTGPVSIAMLAAGRGVTHQTMRLIVMKLVDQGLLSLVQDAEDGRAYLVHMTPAGRAQLKKDRAARTEWLTMQLLSRTNEEERELLKHAVQVLDKLTRESASNERIA